MKIILDTNVFISGIFFSGPPSAYSLQSNHLSCYQTVETGSTPQYKKISSGFYVSVDEKGISIFKEPIWHLKKRLKTEK